jgi:2-dehydro-3-deoxyphosphogluconate aldolase/(4S)-4-hydroxy-2-oxoglutarate aldolase
MNPILEKLSLVGIVPVVAIDDAKDAVPLANAMAKGGVRCAEVTLRTANIARAIADLESKGFQMASGTEKRKDGKLTAVYLEQEFGGFAVHLLKK